MGMDVSNAGAIADALEQTAQDIPVHVSIFGSGDPAIVGKVHRSELRQMVARNCAGPFNLAQQGSVIVTPFSSVTGWVYNGAAAAEDRATLESDPSAAGRRCTWAESATGLCPLLFPSALSTKR